MRILKKKRKGNCHQVICKPDELSVHSTKSPHQIHAHVHQHPDPCTQRPHEREDRSDSKSTWKIPIKNILKKNNKTKQKNATLEIDSGYFKIFSRLGNSPLRFHLFTFQAFRVAASHLEIVLQDVLRKKGCSQQGLTGPPIAAAHRAGDP